MSAGMSPPRTTAAEASAAAASWTDLARRAGEGGASGDEDAVAQLLCFDLGETRYALPVDEVREIVRLRPITPVPRTSRVVSGVISLRGLILQVLDLRERLGLPGTELTSRARILIVPNVLSDGETLCGLLVDAVHEVLRVPASTLRPESPAEGDSVTALCLHEERFVSVFDLAALLGGRPGE